MFSSQPAGLPVGEATLFSSTLREAVEGTDATFVITGWPEFAQADWSALIRLMKQQIVVDGRNLLRHVSWPDTASYLTIGQMPTIKTKGKGLD
jgi:UDP-N-acetyl-D-mannosaminuronate dehydrogenase